ncbi:MAG: polysulfide reductase NrfD [Myxococcales bacterium]|nr:polysulfide reductase NrfD [Myxococcales bacterium]
MLAVEIFTTRQNPAIDPSLAIWNWEIPVYLFLGGLVAGLLVVGALMELYWPERWERRLSRASAGLGIALLSLGMVALFLDLANKIHVYRFYLAFRPTSPMSWGAWILLVAYPAMALWLLASLDAEWLDEALRKRFPWPRLGARFASWLGRGQGFVERHRRRVLYVTASVGVGLGIYTGVLLQTLVARPLWNSALLGPLFLASGVSAGAAFLLLIAKSDAAKAMLLRWDIAALSIELVLLGLFLVDRMSGAQSERAAVSLLTSGPYTGAFFGLVLLLGILVPLWLERRELSGAAHSRFMVPALVLLGGIALRTILVAAGQTSITGLF